MKMVNEKKETYYVSFGTGAETGFVSKKSLEETIKYFEEGNKCYKLCKDILDSAKQKIEVYQGE